MARATTRPLGCLTPSRRSTATSSSMLSPRACTRSVWPLRAPWTSWVGSSAGILVVALAYVSYVAFALSCMLTWSVL